MIDVLLVHPNAIHGIFGPLGDKLVAVEQPLWCRLIAGYLLDRGFTVEILDAEVEHLNPVSAAKIAAGKDAAIVVVVVGGHQPSASSQQMMGAGEFCRALKAANPEQLVVMTGNHPSALPVRTLREEAVDYVVDGEGPVSIEGLLNGMMPETIPGLVWREGDAIRQNPLAKPLDMDKDLHGNAWHLLPMDKFRSHNWQRFDDLSKRQPYAAIHTSLGCSYKCNFCMINVFQHTNAYRMRSPEAVVAEMVMLNEVYGVETFKFTDELFVLNRKHCTAICEGLIASGLGAKISSWCYARTDTVKPDMLPMFRAAGFNWFALGIESGSARVRAAAHKALKNDNDIVNVVRAIEAAGINVISNFIFGLLTDDLESMGETLALALELNTSFANFYCCMAYPGSALYDQALAEGWTLPETWAGYSQHNSDCRPLDTEHLTAKQVLAFRDAAFTRYFTAAAYRDMVLKKFGPETLHHVKEMVQYKLKRKLLTGEIT